MLRALYTAATTLAAPALRAYLRRRAARGKEIAARLPEREGIDPTPRPAGKLLWVHAASMGESISVLPVLAALPDHLSVLLTTGTVTSATLLATRLPQLGLDRRVQHRFVPLDVPAWAARFIDHWRPDVAAFVESETWPNLLGACAARGIPVMLVNARMSGKSFANWRRVPGFARAVFASYAAIQPQSNDDAARLADLGARNLLAASNLKFAAVPLPVEPTALAEVDHLLGDRPAWLAASTHPGEESLIAEAHARLAATRPGLVTIIVPRHPERGAELAAALGAPRRSQGAGPPVGGGIWIADTMGELGLFYRRCPIVFVGKSLISPGGGQNPLEPARLGCAVAMGVQDSNFTEAVRVLRDAGALHQVADASELAAWVGLMFDHPAQRATMGQAGMAAAAGATDLPARLAIIIAGLAGA
jgi:3-deoxy-D-manno-octulosonic-acid transferase